MTTITVSDIPLLADHFIETARTHPLGQRNGLGVKGGGRIVEQAHGRRCFLAF